MGDDRLSECYIARAPNVAFRRLGDAMVVMSAPDSTLFTLNESAALVWEAADGATPLRAIVEQKICAEFDVPAEQALADAEELVTQLAERKILSISAQPRARGGQP